MRVVVIGSGYSGLSAACYLARDGHDVTVVEKLPTTGGRNQQFVVDGFTFERGPSWLWCLEVHEKFYTDMGRNLHDYMDVKKLTPNYRVYFHDDHVDLPNGREAYAKVLEKYEPGCTEKFYKMLELDKFRYEHAFDKFIELPSLHFGEYVDPTLIRFLPWIGLLNDQKTAISKQFKTEKVRRLLEWPVIFVGGSPDNIPEMYGMLNYACIDGGTWMPENGMYETIVGMEKVARELGVKFELGQEVYRVDITNDKISACHTREGGVYTADTFLATCDTAFFERCVLPEKFRMYTPEYWDSREVSPAVLLFYVGVDCLVDVPTHHNLFFDGDMYEHMDDIYKQWKITDKPLFYVSAPSVTNRKFAPDGCESLFFLVPMPQIPVTQQIKDDIFKNIMGRLGERIGNNELINHVIVKQDFDYSDFCKVYHSLSGNAFGLSNTLLQSAFLKPSMKSTKLTNLYYAGENVVPGGGIPTCLLSGRIAARVISDRESMGTLAKFVQDRMIGATQIIRSFI